MRTRTLVATLTLAVLAGCGEDSPEEQVRGVVERFGTASKDKDYQAMCDELLAPSLVKNVEQYGLPCEVALKQGLGEVKAPTLTIVKVDVKADRASARIKTNATGQAGSTDTLQLRRVDNEWRIASLS